MGICGGQKRVTDPHGTRVARGYVPLEVSAEN